MALWSKTPLHSTWQLNCQEFVLRAELKDIQANNGKEPKYTILED